MEASRRVIGGKNYDAILAQIRITKSVYPSEWVDRAEAHINWSISKLYKKFPEMNDSMLGRCLGIATGNVYGELPAIEVALEVLLYFPTLDQGIRVLEKLRETKFSIVDFDILADLNDYDFKKVVASIYLGVAKMDIAGVKKPKCTAASPPLRSSKENIETG